MKKSNILLMGTFFTIIAASIVFLVIIKFSLKGYSSAAHGPQSVSGKGLQVIETAGFDSLTLKGIWRAEVVRGDRYRIILKGDNDLLARLLTHHEGRNLLLDTNQMKDDKRRVTLEITMPMLESLRTKGVVDMKISGFNTAQLDIQPEGVISARLVKGRAENMALNGKGVLKLDCSDFPVRNASIICEGVIKIDLAMAGGGLTGRIKGVGNLRYKGHVTGESIALKGQCKVTRL